MANKFSVKRDSVIEYYDTVAKKFEGGNVEVKEYFRTLERVKDGYEVVKGVNDYDTSECRSKRKEKGTGEILRSNLNRSFSQMMDYINNTPDLTTFLTLTFKENLKDIPEANKCFRYWVDMVRRVFPGFKYIGVLEFQKRGAIHYHILTNLKLDTELITRQKENNSENLPKYDVKYWNYGFSSAFDVVKDTDEKFVLSLYMGKYFFKDIDNRLFGHRKFLKSNNIKKPKLVRLRSDTSEYENSYNNLVKNKVQSGNPKVIIAKESYGQDMIITNYVPTYKL